MTILLLLLPLAAPAETRPEALARLGRESGGYSYFAFARQMLGERAETPAERPAAPDPFGLLSGAAAIDESLALGRLDRAYLRGPRDIPVSSIDGVTLREHPWDRMMGGRKPRPEPLADLAPHDGWYFTCASVEKLAELAGLLDAWGGSALRMVQVQDRDYRLRRRYEAQLGVSVEAARKVPARLVRAVALTGSDLFFAEGTDVTVIIDTPDPAELVKALGSPRHDVIAGRVVLSNSPAALERVRGTAAGRRPSLGSSPDFRYMRTVFEHDAKEEDAFVFLSDPFIRAMVSPATRIKMMRRAEGRAALTLASHAALFRAAEGREAKLDGGALEVPEGRPARWDSGRGEAASELYGTLSAGTALIDLPIESVTREERSAYEGFRRDYDRLWRQFFDPVGVRFKVTPKEIKAEAYILPLVRTEAYDSLRRAVSGESALDPARLAPTAAAQVRFANGPSAFAFQLDDGPGLVRWLAGGLAGEPAKDVVPPFVLATDAPDAEKHLRELADMANRHFERQGKPPLVDRTGETERAYKGVTMRRVPINSDGYTALRKLLLAILDVVDLDPLTRGALSSLFPPKPPEAYHTATLAGVYHLAFDPASLERRIDAWKAGAKPQGTTAAAGLMLSRRSPHLAAFLERTLEEQTRARSHAAATLWQLLADARLITPRMTDAERDGVALRLFGFVPAVPDGSRFVFDAGTRRVRNERHGTWAAPAAHDGPDPASALGRLVRSIQRVSADLRFREDGVHTTVTFARE